MSYFHWLLLAVGLCGHPALCIAAVNRLHGTGLSRVTVKSISALVHAWQGTFWLGVAWFVWRALGDSHYAGDHEAPWLKAYLWFCALFAAYHYPYWFFQRIRQHRSSALAAHHRRVVNLDERTSSAMTSGRRARLCSYVPGNQILQLHVEEKTLRVPRLPAQLAGLSIAHISDLHFTGRITQAYFGQVVELVNALDADLIALTGDICDKTACLAWIEPTLGRLRSRLGTYFILGNHDLRVNDVAALRRTLEQAGLVDVSIEPRSLRIQGQEVLLCGNERPWFDRACEPPGSPFSESHRPLRVLLSHSPDQFAWADARAFDLVLAGHTHGGQVCLPGIGAIVCPSLYGVGYADGVFTRGQSVMHVSRGTSGLFPLRLFCPPEVTKLVLAPG